MTIILSDADAEAITARADAATPGPWVWEDWDEDGGDNPFTLTAPPETRALYKSGETLFPDLRNRLIKDEERDISEADRAFIAHARADIPALLAERSLLLEIVRAVADYPEHVDEDLQMTILRARARALIATSENG